jgi:hypothetical protein
MFQYRRLALTTLWLITAMALPFAAHALTLNEAGFVATTINGAMSKQLELGVGSDTCLYIGTEEGLKRMCRYTDPPTLCDANLTFPVGIAFSTGGSFGNAMYIADYGLNDIWKSPGCTTAAHFANVLGPGAIAFPPSGSAYGDFLYACTAFDGPIYRVSSTGVVTSWNALETTYLRFGPGGVWGQQLYATESGDPPTARIVKVSSTGAVTQLATGFFAPEGFDWGFDGDMFATDVIEGEVYRIKSNGTKTLFATLNGAADVAFRPSEQALYIASNMGGIYRVVRGSVTDVGDVQGAQLALAVAPNPARGSCTFRLNLPQAGLARVRVVDAAGRLVRRMPEAWRPAGSYSLTWDARDDSGSPVRSGVYFAQVHAAGESRNTRVTIVR